MRKGFSLLEVILALAILTGAIAVIGELARMGMHHAQRCRDLAQAQLLCESKMAEITSGMVVPENVAAAPFEMASSTSPLTTTDQTEIEWLYSIEVESLGDQGLLWVRVTVGKNAPTQRDPAEVSLVRWIIDPGVEPAEESSEESAGSESSETEGSS